MKIYTGWILKIGGIDFAILGCLKIRGHQSYVLKSMTDGTKTSIGRGRLLAGMEDKSITYMGNI